VDLPSQNLNFLPQFSALNSAALHSFAFRRRRCSQQALNQLLPAPLKLKLVRRSAGSFRARHLAVHFKFSLWQGSTWLATGSLFLEDFKLSRSARLVFRNSFDQYAKPWLALIKRCMSLVSLLMSRF
jgi:hypothetical protein